MVKALINPFMLKWVRERSGFDVEDVAAKLKKEATRLLEWENGEHQPTFKQLLEISRIYKRPVSLFYLSNPPDDFIPLKDYRRLPRSQIPLKDSPKLKLEIRKAHGRRQIALELFEILNEEIPNISYTISINDNPENIGIEIRRFLGISIQKQTEWKTEYDALHAWRKALESIGVLVFQAEGVEVSEMRGFAISSNSLPVVVVNKKDTPRGRIFSMIHEFAHILLRDSSISGSEIIEKTQQSEMERIEIFCNKVAASTLLPLSFFQEDRELALYDAKNNWGDTIVKSMAKRFNVSEEFIWRRLLTRGKISQKLYQIKRDALQEKFKNYPKKKESGGPAYHIKLISSLGNLYSKLVLASYHQEKITSSALSEYMGINLKHLSKIEKAIFGATL